jgi:two-component system response regulator HupR/HoxA
LATDSSERSRNRLSTMTLHVPALRERPQDIPFISQQVLDKAKIALGKPVKGFTQEAMDCLTAYRWPGNVRELQNEINRMLALSDADWLGAEYLNGSLKDRLEMLEARVLKEAMVRHRWNKTRVADELGLSRVGLRAKLTRYGLERKNGA